MIELDELQRYCIVSVQVGEGGDIVHMGSARMWNRFLILHEVQVDGVNCCAGRITAIPLDAVGQIDFFADAAGLRLAIEEDHIQLPGERRPDPRGPEVM